LKPCMNQIALSVIDRQASKAFYAELFGLQHVGGTHFTGKVTEQVQGMPGATSDVIWMMDDREFFQLELFQFQTPSPRTNAANRKPWDIGYSRLALEVNDLERSHALFSARGVEGLTAIQSIAGKAYFLLTDPNGVLVEVGTASSPIPTHIGARMVGVALSVPSMEVALESFHQSIGCPLVDTAPADKGPLWNEPACQKKTVLLDAGSIWLEINEYAELSIAPWPEGYQICDHGLLNVAFGSRDAEELRSLYQKMIAGGFKQNTELVSSMGQVLVTYLNDPKGFNVELLMVKPWLDGVMGFRKANWFDRILMKVMMAFV